MTANPTDSFTRNKFVEKVMRWIPDDPLTQAEYLYVLTAVVFFGIIGYAFVAWYNFFASLHLTSFFSAVFMTAIGLMTLLGLKQTRSSYHMIKEMKANQNKPVPTMEDMLKGFK